MELESIRHLKHYAHNSMKIHTMNKVIEIADEIERENSEKYMELPVDADGVPIRVGDKMELVASEEYPDNYLVGSGEVVGYSFKDGEAAVLTQALPAPIHSRPNMLRHVKPDPVKELIENLVRDVYGSYYLTAEQDRQIDECAMRIREAVEK